MFECFTENIVLKAAMIFAKGEARKKDKDTYSMLFTEAHWLSFFLFKSWRWVFSNMSRQTSFLVDTYPTRTAEWNLLTEGIF